MPVSLSIKAVPDALVERLRLRAAGNHRSLQRELMAIVEAAVQPEPKTEARTRTPAPSSALVLRVAESEPVWQALASSANDGLLDELDRIVSGSHWGEAPLLSREQLHDRALAREIDFDSRQLEGKAAARKKGGAP